MDSFRLYNYVEYNVSKYFIMDMVLGDGIEFCRLMSLFLLFRECADASLMLIFERLLFIINYSMVAILMTSYF